MQVSHSFLKEVESSALSSRGVVIRPPKKSEFSRIQAKLYIYNNSEAFKNVVEGEGCEIFSDEEQDFGWVLEAKKCQSTVSKLYGAIHYGFEFGVCYIRSVKVHDKLQKQGYGSLLMAIAIAHTKDQNITCIKLATTDEGVPLHVAHGCCPEIVHNEFHMSTRWFRFSKEEKIRFTRACDSNILCLNLNEDNISHQECLKKALTVGNGPQSQSYLNQ